MKKVMTMVGFLLLCGIHFAGAQDNDDVEIELVDQNQDAFQSRLWFLPATADVSGFRYPRLSLGLDASIRINDKLRLQCQVLKPYLNPREDFLYKLQRMYHGLPDRWLSFPDNRIAGFIDIAAKEKSIRLRYTYRETMGYSATERKPTVHLYSVKYDAPAVVRYSIVPKLYHQSVLLGGDFQGDGFATDSGSIVNSDGFYLDHLPSEQRFVSSHNVIFGSIGFSKTVVSKHSVTVDADERYSMNVNWIRGWYVDLIFPVYSWFTDLNIDERSYTPESYEGRFLGPYANADVITAKRLLPFDAYGINVGLIGSGRRFSNLLKGNVKFKYEVGYYPIYDKSGLRLTYSIAFPLYGNK